MPEMFVFLERLHHLPHKNKQKQTNLAKKAEKPALGLQCTSAGPMAHEQQQQWAVAEKNERVWIQASAPSLCITCAPTRGLEPCLATAGSCLCPRQALTPTQGQRDASARC